jgi:gliding motility-associated-like protein
MNKTTIVWRVFPLLVPFFLICYNTQAQVVPNDDCNTATIISDPTNYCSDPDGESNIQATASAVTAPTCFPPVNNDVWYRFEAAFSSVNIFVFESIFSSMQAPSIALYAGDCPNTLTEIGCASNVQPAPYQKLQVANLVQGQTYFIRIGSLTPGTFQLCMQHNNLESVITGDCPTAIVVCDKQSRAIQFVAGPGDNPNEWSDATCLNGFPGEFNSSWFTFTAATNGTLEFTLSPSNISDDLDFMVYRLPNGPGDCTGKILERCMAAGSIDPVSGCYGPTGLNTVATDLSQPPDCAPGADNFLRYMDITAGATYALSVNNFTASGNGFTIDWGGTAEFAGPAIGFTSDDADNVVCLGAPISFTDTSLVSSGFIDGWQWSFGLNATPFSDTTEGPHTIRYLNKGLKTVDLIIHTSTGCTVQTQLDILVDSCCTIEASVVLGPDCLPDTTCQQATAVVENAFGPLLYNWSSGQTDSIATMLEDGDYTLVVKDVFGCADTVSFTVDVVKISFNMPNAFTPNGDQANDQFGPVVSTVEVLQFQVWNRWGSLVFDDPENGWDGNINGIPAPSDVYVYRVQVRWPDGREEIRKGDVTLLR